MKKCLYLLIALLAFTATTWAQNSIDAGSESDLRNYLTHQQYDNYTINLTSDITIHAQYGEIEVGYRNTINMNGKSIVAENASIRIFHVMPQGTLPYMPSLTLTGNGTLSGGGATDGGAIYNEGMLTLQNVTIQNCTASAKGGAIYSKGTLTMNGGSITGNTAGNGAAINLYGGTFTMTGGTISGNSTIVSGDANKNCGGVNLTGNSTMTMSGGSIADNISLNKDGGVYIGSGCTFNMTGGSITGNSAAANYGGIRVDGVFNMSGGSISGNTATDSFGGIGVDESGTLNLTGGSITGNNATNNYGGIWINGTLNMSGNPIVSGNLAANSTASNVYLRSGKTITVNGAFTEGANIHVTHADGLDGNGYRDFASGYATYNGSTDPATVFRSDNAAYEVGLHASTGEASLITATHLYDVPYLNVDETGEHGMATRATCTMMSPFDSDSPLTLNDNYWYVVDQDKTFSERITISGTVNLILTDNTQLTANKGIYVPFGSTLHIWAQSTKIETADHQGFILATANETNCSGIGGMIGGGGAGYLHFHGGIIAATGGKNAAGIYGMIILDEGVYGTNIYGGQVIAQGGEYGAGIGGCYAITCGNIRITGGTVIAQAGDKAAGIGSGYRGLMHFRDSGYTGNPATGQTTEIRITGGNVTAIAVTGAGIGGGEGHDSQLSGYGGYEGDGASVYIDGGTVEAWTKDTFAAGINGEVGSNAIGWGYMGTPTYGNTQADSPLEIYASAKVSATTDANALPDEIPLLAAGAWQNNAWTRYKKIKIEPCDHPNGTNYSDNGSSLNVGCNHCLAKEPYTFQTAGNWNDASHWLSGFRPDNDNKTGNNVAVKAAATIPSGCTANVGNIDMQEGGSITINDGGQLIHSNAGVTATVQKIIEGYTQAQSQGETKANGWYFIASPISTALAPNDVANMLSNTYDLYRFNPTAEKEWENFKNQEGHPDFTLNNGAGYLYANQSQVTLGFMGELKPYSEADGANQVSVSNGWNLVGNPFACNVYADQPFYKMNADGTGIEAVSSYSANAIAPCTGIMVEAAAGNMTFTKDAPQQNANQGNIQIALAEATNNRGAATALDNAIVTFDEGATLGKFYFGEQSANIYLPQGGAEYAIAHSDKQGEMPLNFKANKDGQYTLTVNPEGVEVGYLHLIDNMTGADIDLLQTPSYSFNATVTDYESRFKLVFASEDANDDDETFAFISDGNLIVNGTGTLQVIDMLGHQLLSRDIHSALTTSNASHFLIQHSSFSIPHSSFPTGVYVLRLINGDRVKTQKIVID